MKGEQVEFALSPKHLRSPAVLSRGGFDFAPDGADVNRLAAIAAEIFTKLLHAENFTQRCEEAKKFLARIAGIDFRRGDTKARRISTTDTSAPCVFFAVSIPVLDFGSQIFK